MRDELPSQEIFDSVCELYETFKKNTIKLPEGFSEYELALVALASKAITHTREALRLFVEHGAVGEAAILLRSAYEATVVFLYLRLHPEDFCKYKGYSELVELRNQMEVLELAGDLDESAKNEQLDINKRQRIKILNNNFHSYYSLSEYDLHNLSLLKKVSNKAHFINFGEMQKKLLKDEFSSGLVTTAFQVYNLGSQMAHSHYSMTVCTYVLDRSHPVYNVYDIAKQIAVLFTWNALGMDKIGYMKAGFPQIIDPLFRRVLDQIRTEISASSS